MSIYKITGMQAMNSESEEVCNIIKVLSIKIKSCHEPLTPQEIGNALYGLQGCYKVTETVSILEFLYSQLSRLSTASSQFTKLSVIDLISLCQHIMMTLSELHDALIFEYEQWLKMKDMLSEELGKRRSNNDVFFYSGNFRSSAEERVGAVVNKVFGNSEIEMTSNEYLFSLFESDIVLRIPKDNKSSHSQLDKIVINIEVDGIHHKREIKKRFCMLRDKYLASEGVIIQRIESISLQKMDDEELKGIIVKLVEDAKALNNPVVASEI